MPALSTKTVQDRIIKQFCSIPDFKYTEEEMHTMLDSYESQNTKNKKLTVYNVFLKEQGLSPKTMGDAWKDIQENSEEMERLQAEVDKLNEGRDNNRASKPRGASSWNNFVSNNKGKTREYLKEAWATLSQEEKNEYKS